MTRKSLLVLACGWALLSGGCAGYRFSGGSLPTNIGSIYVPTFLNKTGEPELESVVTSAAVREFQKDGTMKVLDEEQADAVLEVVLTRLDLEPLRYSKDKTAETTEFRMLLSADVRLREKKTGRIVVDAGHLVGRTTFEPAGDLSSAKTAAFPALAGDMSHRIVEAVVETW